MRMTFQPELYSTIAAALEMTIDVVSGGITKGASMTVIFVCIER